MNKKKRNFNKIKINGFLGLLLVSMFIVEMVILTLISSQALGLNVNVWEQIQEISLAFTLAIVVIPIAMHWNWIVQNSRKHLLSWMPNLSIRQIQIASQPAQKMHT